MAKALLQRVLLPPTLDSLLAHHFASNLIAPAILKEERASTFRRRLLSYSCIPLLLPDTEFPEHAPRPEL